MPDEPANEAPTPAPTPEAHPPTSPEQVAAHHLDAGHHHGHAQLPPLRFLEEIKRRNVGRVAILYIVVSYVVLEVFEMFFHLLEMPPWTGRAAVLLAVLGFPIALLIAWAYEVTPEGLKPTDEVAPHQSIRHLTGRRLDRAIIAVLAIALSYFVVDKFWLSSHRAVTPSTATASTVVAATQKAAASVISKSIAVLPFLDLSEKHDQGYFADGMAEELIDLLARTPALHVIARTSSFSFRGKPDDIPTIAAKLKVSHILEGSVRKAGNRLRVTTQLVRAANGEHVWSETYDREEKDVFRVQDEIAQSVVGALKVRLSAPLTQEGSRGTKSLEAYYQYLLGKQFFSRSNIDGLKRAVAAYQNAIKLDPQYAAAYAELVIAQVYLTDILGDMKGRDQVEATADRAVQLAPERAEGYSSRGWVRHYLKWDWVGAEADLRKAVELNPADSVTVYRLSDLLQTLGRPQEALQYMRRAIDLDPRSSSAWSHLSTLLYDSGDTSAAREAIIRALDIEPTNSFVQFLYAQTELRDGHYEAASKMYRNIELDYLRDTGLAMSEHALGHDAAADAALKDLIVGKGNTAAYQIADAYAWRNERAQALDWLERAYRQRDGGLESIKSDPLLRNVRMEPRYLALLKKMNFPQ
jgi:TolB-like protein/regulator of sirC expression with transglutaminase-like and TPR domain